MFRRLGPLAALGVVLLYAVLQWLWFYPDVACFALPVTAFLEFLIAVQMRVAWEEVRDDLRRDRVRHALCPECGYDARFTSGRCPECGAPSPLRGEHGPLRGKSEEQSTKHEGNPKARGND